MKGFRKWASFVIFGVFFVAGAVGAVEASTNPSPRAYDDTVAYETTEGLYQVMSEIPMADVERITITNTTGDLPSNLSGEYIQVRVEIKTTNKAVELPFASASCSVWVCFAIWLSVAGGGFIISFGFIYPWKMEGGEE